MTTTLIVIVTVHDTEVSRFETVLSSKESIAFKYKGFEHVQQDGTSITFKVPLVVTKP
jgi:hypothetical protein